MTAVPTHQVKGASPLRYPGGKSALSGFLASTIAKMGLRRPTTYVEPYAGGAGAALTLLQSGTVQSLVINDADPAIYAFWAAAVHQNREFRDLIHETPVTLQEWHRQREIYRERDYNKALQLGFATFFLNRTNRSGVLNAGVIGGQKQAGRYKVDARFNKEDLLRRVALLEDFGPSIRVSGLDGRSVIREHIRLKRSFIYADPPYYDKGSFLYKNSFTREDHALLASLLNSNPHANWLLTYDNATDIRALYAGRHTKLFDLSYSAHRSGKMTELMIASDKVAQALAD
ncbi:MAG: DNA adenine methylase [Candidatus Phosphoribacter baldrii]|nr:DNA methyltransferase [Actinomycetota bacterium]